MRKGSPIRNAADPEGPVARLFPDFRPLEQRYCREMGGVLRHLVVLRRALWEANLWIARSLTDAFVRCNRAAAAALSRLTPRIPRPSMAACAS